MPFTIIKLNPPREQHGLPTTGTNVRSAIRSEWGYIQDLAVGETRAMFKPLRALFNRANNGIYATKPILNCQCVLCNPALTNDDWSSMVDTEQ